MSLVCIAAARARIIPFWLAVTVAVLGGLGPFAGTIGFVVAQRRNAGNQPRRAAVHDSRGRVSFRQNVGRNQHR